MMLETTQNSIFPWHFSMTMLSWSLIEYSHKYQSIGKYDHIRDLIKWGTDYLLITFNSSATKIDKIYCQVGGSLNDSTITPDAGPDLASEMAVASIVFSDNGAYSCKFIKGAQTVFAFAMDGGKRRAYSRGNPYIFFQALTSVKS